MTMSLTNVCNRGIGNNDIHGVFILLLLPGRLSHSVKHHVTQFRCISLPYSQAMQTENNVCLTYVVFALHYGKSSTDLGLLTCDIRCF